MPEAHNLSDIRLSQIRSNLSAANALVVTLGYSGPAEGKLWTVTGIGYKPSVAETQVVSFEKYSAKYGATFALLNPIEMNLNPAYGTCIEQGQVLQLFPGDYINVRRVAATAGSTMAVYIELIETDLPLYEYTEPQMVKRNTIARGTILRRIGGVSGGGVSGGGIVGGGHPPGGGGGGALPV